MKAISVESVSKRFILSHSRAKNLADAARALTWRASPDVFWALKDVSFEVESGKALGIIGHNGAGKSTMLKLLTRIMEPTSGRIRTRGRISALIEIGAGFHPEMTGRENIFLNGSILGMTKREIAAKFDDIVAFAELERFIDTPVKRYSSGMYARLGFAVIANLDPDVMLVDEVLSVGDESFQVKCQKRMSDLMRSGATLVFVSHNLPAVMALCPRTLVINRGQVVFEGETAEAVRVARRIPVTEGNESGGLQDAPADLPARIVGARILDGDGRETEEIETGAPMTIEISGEAAVHIPGLVFGVEINRADGVGVYEVNSRMDQFLPDVPAGGFRYRLAVPECNLTDGVYFVTLGLMDRDERIQYHLIRRRLHFTVRDRSPYRGIARLGHTWELEVDDSPTRQLAG